MFGSSGVAWSQVTINYFYYLDIDLLFCLCVIMYVEGGYVDNNQRTVLIKVFCIMSKILIKVCNTKFWQILNKILKCSISMYVYWNLIFYDFLIKIFLYM